MRSSRTPCQPQVRHITLQRTSIPSSMETFINTKLHPVQECVVCTEPFSVAHQPVTLDCKHIFGHKCISRWLRDGRGNNASCPVCRHVLFPRKSLQFDFDAPSIWKRLCEVQPERLHAFMEKLWIGIRDLRRRKPDGNFIFSELLEKAVFPSLIETGAQAQRGLHDAFIDAHSLITASWDSSGRPNRAEGLAIPLVRLARLVSSAANTLPLYLTDLSRTTRLIWRANACLGLTEEDISWNIIVESSRLVSSQHFPLLHLYTALISQSIAHTSGPQQPLPARRHELMNLVVKKCCTRIGTGCYTGKASNAFKETLVRVFQELWRYQHVQARLSLRGHVSEESIVRGIWAIAAWPIRRDH